MDDPPLELGRAPETVGAQREWAADLHGCATVGAAVGHFERWTSAPALLWNDLHDLGDDIASPLDPHQVTFSDVLPAELLTVV